MDPSNTADEERRRQYLIRCKTARNELADMLGDLQQAQSQIIGLLRYEAPQERDLFVNRLESVRAYLVSAESLRAGLLKLKEEG